jgi:hypothetical protein
MHHLSRLGCAAANAGCSHSRDTAASRLTEVTRGSLWLILGLWQVGRTCCPHHPPPRLTHVVSTRTACQVAFRWTLVTSRAPVRAREREGGERKSSILPFTSLVVLLASFLYSLSSLRQHDIGPRRRMPEHATHAVPPACG